MKEPRFLASASVTESRARMNAIVERARSRPGLDRRYLRPHARRGMRYIAE